MAVAGHAVLDQTNCTDVACLRSLPALNISALSTQARYLVVDGKYLTTDHLQLNGTGSAARIPLMVGTMRDDGAAFISYPSVNESLTNFLSANSLPTNLDSSAFPVPTAPNNTLDIFNVSARISTDGQFRCVDEATAYAGVVNHIFPTDSVFYYEFNRSYQLVSYEPNYPVCEPPDRNPDNEYWKCHSGELYYVFGNLARSGLSYRDENDLPFSQFIVDTWSSFARTHSPNPEAGFLEARGYNSTARELQKAGKWRPVTKSDLTYRRLQWPSVEDRFQEKKQCAAVGIPIDYYA